MVSRSASTAPRAFRFGVPRAEDLEFFGNPEAPVLFADAMHRLEAIGGTVVPVDFAPFREAGAMMFDGPWVAERVAAVGDFVAAHGEDVLPVTRSIFATAASLWSGRHVQSTIPARGA